MIFMMWLVGFPFGLDYAGLNGALFALCLMGVIYLCTRTPT